MNKTAKNTLIYFMGTFVLAVAGFINTMLLTRFLEPQVYALYGLLMTFTTAAIMLVSLGYDAAYTRFYYATNQTKINFFVTCLKVPLLAGLLFCFLLIEPNQFVIRWVFGSALSWKLLLLICIYILFSLIHRFSQLTARMEEKAVNYVASNLVGKIGYILLILGLVLMGKYVDFGSILVTFVITTLLAVFINFVLFASIQNKPYGNESISQRELFKYGFPVCINCSFILLIPMLERIIIRDTGGWILLSLYTAAAIFQTVVSMVSLTLDNIWNPIVFQTYENKVKFQPLLHYSSLGITCLLTLGLVGVILTRRWLVLILDKNYIDVLIIAPTIFYAACLAPISSVLGVGINIKKRTIHLIISPLLQVLFSIPLLYLLVPRGGLRGIGIAVLTSVFISRMYRVIVGLHLYNTGEAETKCYFLFISSLLACITTLYYTSLQADISMALLLGFISLIIINKELKPMYHFFYKKIQKSPANTEVF